ncbi:MAG TPA: asparagine synthase-related protein [Vicinamibacterales bacterium]|nr:asparagine synthase-related protein [Vicinamibacterales bacterium]
MTALATLDRERSLETAAHPPRGEWCLSVDRDGEFTLLPGAWGSPSSAAGRASRAVFDGTLYNRAALESELEVPRGAALNDAELVLRAYEKFGASLFAHIKGVFGAVIWDVAEARLLVSRDPIGVQPLFYAEQNGRFIFSVSAERIVRTPGVSARLNDRAIADWLSHRWPDAEETFFDAVKRMRPGYVLTVGRSGRRMERYWDPAPPGQPVQWLKEDDLERFDDVFSQAIDRCMHSGPSGIFLSGGLDSVSIAAVATDLARRRKAQAPAALSLAFPGDECNEESVQASVASQLGLDQTMVPFNEAVGPQGLLQAALDLGRTWPQPMMNAWNPAYIHLGSLAARKGCRVILTGSGGDEWLTVSSYHTADLLGAFDVSGLAHMLSSIRRSYKFSWLNIMRATLWVYGIRPWLTIAANAVAPGAVHDARMRRIVATTPDWVAPGEALRQELNRRAVGMILPPKPENGFYLREMRQSLEHPLQAVEMENAFVSGRRTGAALRHPFWDPDLVDLMFRIPPRLLNQGGRTKGMVRDAIARRFPDLGFERHRKVFAYGFFGSVVKDQGPAAWSRLGGAKTLADLGVVDGKRVDALAAHLFSGKEPREMYRIWDILHLEAWAQTWA